DVVGALAARGRGVRLLFSFHRPVARRDLHSFPTRRSSDLGDSLSVVERGTASTVSALGCWFLASMETMTTGRGFFSGGSEGNLRSEEHTSELQSRGHLVCRLLREKKNT